MRYGITSEAMAAKIVHHFEVCIDGLHLPRCKASIKPVCEYGKSTEDLFEEMLCRYLGKVPCDRLLYEQRDKRMIFAKNFLRQALCKKIAYHLEVSYSSDQEDFLSPLMHYCQDIASAIDFGFFLFLAMATMSCM